MPVTVVNHFPNQNIPPGLTGGGPVVLSGVVACVFKGVSDGEISRDLLTFKVGRVSLPGTIQAPTASCVMSPASVAFDGPARSLLWAVDAARVTEFADPDSGSGTANLVIEGDLAVRGLGGVMLRVNYVVFFLPTL